MRIGLYGDSTQMGLSRQGNVSVQNEFPPSKTLQMMLDQKYGAGIHCVSNYGIGGSTIIQALDTPLFEGKNVVQHMDCHCDDIVVANWGINDAYVVGNTANAHKAYYTCLKNFVEAREKRFIYESPNPLNNSHDQIMVALDTGVKAITSLTIADISWQTRMYYPQWAAHLDDGIHPNAILYFWVGMVLFKTVDSVIQSMAC
ncbi:SGNH/GDSL hydrolase family protein [Rhizobium sp. BK661]|uniref:SGNH/GDSL hydrolase family protein n=1 Tax=Rhizobium sp. BK661 TaxID=2586991 RepID=UPI00216A5C3F|nr:SGNH/GDSL hydrolase family protein [Rhizobium sp. BK661]MCS3741999.1 hypothetical protein [Rhizobium sp. BK661]